MRRTKNDFGSQVFMDNRGWQGVRYLCVVLGTDPLATGCGDVAAGRLQCAGRREGFYMAAAGGCSNSTRHKTYLQLPCYYNLTTYQKNSGATWRNSDGSSIALTDSQVRESVNLLLVCPSRLEEGLKPEPEPAPGN